MPIRRAPLLSQSFVGDKCGLDVADMTSRFNFLKCFYFDILTNFF